MTTALERSHESSPGDRYAAVLELGEQPSVEVAARRARSRAGA
jgi:hypothetical protein